MSEYKPYGDQWKREILKNTKAVILDILTDKITELQHQIESSRCCGNCSHMSDGLKCGFELPMTGSSNYCDKWQSDGLTLSEREIK